MYKIGTDIVKISRIEKSIKSQSFLNKVLPKTKELIAKKLKTLPEYLQVKKLILRHLERGLSFR